jgi:hypothetical protein
MKFISSISLLLLFPALLQAQQKVALKNTAAENSTPSLPVSGISVMLCLSDSTSLGYVNSTESTEKVCALPDGNCSQWLQKYINAQYRSSFSRTGRQLLWVISDLNIGTDPNNKISQLKLKASAYLAEAAGYSPICTLDTIFTKEQVTDYGKSVADAMNVLFAGSTGAALKTAAENAKKEGSIFSNKDELYNQQANRFNMPILKANNYQQGVYLSFEEFRKNKPSVFDIIAKADSTDQVTLYQLSADSTQIPITNAWGLSFNNELYMLENGKLIPVERSASSIALSRFKEPASRSNQAIFWRNYIGRQSGNNNPFKERKTASATKSVSPVYAEATRVDMETGLLTF